MFNRSQRVIKRVVKKVKPNSSESKTQKNNTITFPYFEEDPIPKEVTSFFDSYFALHPISQVDMMIPRARLPNA